MSPQVVWILIPDVSNRTHVRIAERFVRNLAPGHQERIGFLVKADAFLSRGARQVSKHMPEDVQKFADISASGDVDTLAEVLYQVYLAGFSGVSLAYDTAPALKAALTLFRHKANESVRPKLKVFVWLHGPLCNDEWLFVQCGRHADIELPQRMNRLESLDIDGVLISESLHRLSCHRMPSGIQRIIVTEPSNGSACLRSSDGFGHVYSGLDTLKHGTDTWDIRRCTRDFMSLFRKHGYFVS